MANEESRSTASEKETAQAKQKLKDEKKKLGQEQKDRKKAASIRVKEISKQAAALDEDTESSGFSTFLVTTIIVIVWLAIIGILIKLDVGGFASSVLSPVLKNVPVINMILPEGSVTDSIDGAAYDGYTNLQDAVDQIKNLELQLQTAQTLAASNSDEIDLLKAEVERLQVFETNQADFERLKLQFSEDIVWGENGSGPDAYLAYFEALDPTTAEYLYRQVVQQIADSQEITTYAETYSNMKPKEAAAIFETMGDNLELAAKILGVMDTTNRGKILGAMDPAIAAKITKIMDPDS